MKAAQLIKNIFSFWIVAIVLAGSLFIGLMLATAGGAIYPPIVTVIAPVACSGTVEAASHSYSYRPGEQFISREIYCVEPGGNGRRDITLLSVFYAFLIYSAIALIAGLIFVAPLLAWLHRKWGGAFKALSQDSGNWRETLQTSQYTTDQNHIVIDLRASGNADQENNPGIQQRLQQLKELRDKGLITEQDYESKKTELLSQL